MTTYLIVDDHAAFRRQARALLEAEGVHVIGEAHDGASALAAVAEIGPDVVLLDVGLPDRDGFDVAVELGRLASPPRVVLISSREASEFRSRLADAPVAGFVQKDDLSAGALQRVLGAG
jgi:DNA-binding NarL/FixJ family response regulator